MVETEVSRVGRRWVRINCHDNDLPLGASRSQHLCLSTDGTKTTRSNVSERAQIQGPRCAVVLTAGLVAVPMGKAAALKRPRRAGEVWDVCEVNIQLTPTCRRAPYPQIPPALDVPPPDTLPPPPGDRRIAARRHVGQVREG